MCAKDLMSLTINSKLIFKLIFLQIHIQNYLKTLINIDKLISSLEEIHPCS
jgi:hypothetical protein